MFRRRGQLRIAHHHERLRHHETDAGRPRLTGLRNSLPAERRMVANVVGRVAVRHLPDNVAAIEIDRGDRAVWRLENRDPVDRQSATAAATTCSCAAAGWCTSAGCT